MASIDVAGTFSFDFEPDERHPIYQPQRGRFIDHFTVDDHVYRPAPGGLWDVLDRMFTDPYLGKEPVDAYDSEVEGFVRRIEGALISQYSVPTVRNTTTSPGGQDNASYGSYHMDKIVVWLNPRMLAPMVPFTMAHEAAHAIHHRIEPDTFPINDLLATRSSVAYVEYVANIAAIAVTDANIPMEYGVMQVARLNTMISRQHLRVWSTIDTIRHANDIACDIVLHLCEYAGLVVPDEVGDPNL